MNFLGRRLATLAGCGAALLVLVIYAPALQAPFLVPKFAALELTASLGVVAFVLDGASRPRKQWMLLVRIGAFLVLGATMLAWVLAANRPLGAPYAVDALARWGALLGLACCACVLDDASDDAGCARQRVLEAVTIGAAVVAAVGLLQHFAPLALPLPVISMPGSTFGNRNMAAEVMALALPLGLGALAGARAGPRRVMLGGLVLEAVFLAVTRARGAWLGAGIGLGAAFVMGRRRWSRASLAVGSVVMVAAVVAAAVPGRLDSRDAGDTKRYSSIVQVIRDTFDPHSTAQKTRLGLWRRTLAMVRDHPVFGVGPGNWPVVFPHYAEPGAAEDGVLSATLAPRQAHNDLLQVAAETGVVGVAALGVLMVGTASSIRRRLRTENEERRATVAAAAGALIALVVLSLASFPLEMPGTLALSGLALGLVVVDPGAERVRVQPRGLTYAWALFGLVLVGWAIVRAQRSIVTSRWLGVAERSMHKDADPAKTAESVRAFERALTATPHEFRARLRIAQLLVHLRPGEAADAARQALATEPYSPNAWGALAAAELAAGDPTAARQDATRALSLLEDYPFGLHVRAEAAEQEGDVTVAEADRQRLRTLAATSPDRDTSSAARSLLETGK